MLVQRLAALAISAAIALGAAATAVAKPPLEAFGDVPAIRAAELSPDGRRLAFLNRTTSGDILVLHDLQTRETKPLVNVSDPRAESIRFVGGNHIILVASETRRMFGFRGRFDDSKGWAVNIATGENVQLLTRTPDIFPAQTGLGNIVAVDADGEHVYMPVFMGASSVNASLDILRVNLDSGRGFTRGGKKGVSFTIDWIMNDKGDVLAREDYDEKSELHEIRVYDGDRSRPIYSRKSELIDLGLIGVSPTGDKLIASNHGDSEFMSLFEMSMSDGSLSGPVLERDNADVAGVVMDDNRVVRGVRYSGMYPSYAMFDKTVDAAIKAAQNALSDSSLNLVSWSADWSKLLFYASGGSEAERYMLLDMSTLKLTPVAILRPDISAEDVGEVVTVEYRARDGLTIPAIITWPSGSTQETRTNLPLVVLPHGGPEAYDDVGFDWLAQFLANEGYMVLQPNFRGSAGFGASFRDAGRGQWGRKMQDDITDGAKALATMGWADPQRTCIVGWSYGGYAALAGGALTPDLYKCVASIAGVSNLRDMLADERLQHGSNSRTVKYWEMLIGDSTTDRDAIDAVSPARIADRFQMPVLLIHGTDDLVVPASQSQQMHDALRRAGKQVEYLKIRGDDHGLRSNESRREMLTTLAAFLKSHIGAPN